MNLAMTESRPLYEVGREFGMKLVMIMAKISATNLFMASVVSMMMDIDFPFPPNGDCLRGTYQFLICRRSIDAQR